MTYIASEDILKARDIDLLSYLKKHAPNELVRVGHDVYSIKTHDSLKISNGKWMWWSRGVGGKSALDYLIKVEGMSFLDAVHHLLDDQDLSANINYQPKEKSYKPLLLPQKSKDNTIVKNYLMSRAIDEEIIDHCLDQGIVYESLPYHNVVFVGFDENNKPAFGAYRATNDKRILGDCSGSKKEYSFRIVNKNIKELHLFEAPIDLLSYATLIKMSGDDWLSLNYVSLSGVYAPMINKPNIKIPLVLQKLFETHKDIKKIYLHLDNDLAGTKATIGLQNALSNYEVIDERATQGKDINDFLCLKLKIFNHKERRIER